jgi:hypothetical protein
VTEKKIISNEVFEHPAKIKGPITQLVRVADS